MQKTIGEDRWRDDLPKSVSQQTVSLFRDMTEADADDRIQNYEILIDRIDDLKKQTPIQQNAASIPVHGESEPSKPEHSEPVHSKPAHSEPVHNSSTNNGSAPTFPSNRFTSRRTVLSIASIILLCTVVILGVVFRPASLSSVSNQETENWTADGFPQPLFNGQSVPRFRKTGSWSPSVVSDGSRVLTGQTGSAMTIPLALSSTTTQNLRLRLALTTNDQRITEIGIRHANRDSDEAMLRFRDGIAEFVPIGDTAEQSETISIPLTQSTQDNTVFQRIVVMRRDTQISLLINGETMGTVSCDPATATAIQLRSVAGFANYADVDIVALKRETPQL